MKKVLITGATGFIGGNLVKGNLAKGNRVRAMVLPYDPGATLLKERGVEVVQGDVRDFESVKKGHGKAWRSYSTARPWLRTGRRRASSRR